ncbi:MAG TPA: cytochrome c [Stellaceae bacterium]|nr:cytochrome c [Stellaceae bacterium]
MHPRLFIAAFALFAALNAGETLAQDKPEIIRERQALMKRQAEDLKAIQGYVSGTIDRATAVAKVNELLSLPGKIVDLFPPGTSLAEFPGETHAKPEIWQQHDRFKEVPIALQRAEEKLAATLKNGSKQDVVDALDAVGRSGCGACHTYFRAPLQ